MAKFHVKLKLQGLELEVEGSRDDIPSIRQSLNQQLAGLLEPATDMAEGKISKPITIQSQDDGSIGNGSIKRRRKLDPPRLGFHHRESHRKIQCLTGDMIPQSMAALRKHGALLIRQFGCCMLLKVKISLRK